MKRITQTQICILAGAAIAFLWMYHGDVVTWADLHSGTAGWVQAVGSVCAIFIAVWTVDRAHALQQKNRQTEVFDEYTRFLEGVFQLVGGVASVAKKVFDFESGGGTLSPRELQTVDIELSALASALRRVDVTRLDRYEYVRALLLADNYAHLLLEAAREVSKTNYSRLLDRHLLQNTANTALMALEENVKAMEQGIKTRGGVVIDDRRP